MRILGLETMAAYADARTRVIEAAMAMADRWQRWPILLDDMTLEAQELVQAVHALRSLDADRGVRNPGPPREQATGQEPAHGEDSHDREQS